VESAGPARSSGALAAPCTAARTPGALGLRRRLLKQNLKSLERRLTRLAKRDANHFSAARIAAAARERYVADVRDRRRAPVTERCAK